MTEPKYKSFQERFDAEEAERERQQNATTAAPPEASPHWKNLQEYYDKEVGKLPPPHPPEQTREDGGNGMVRSNGRWVRKTDAVATPEAPRQDGAARVFRTDVGGRLV